jgi:iron complex outermembrane recepter protein
LTRIINVHSSAFASLSIGNREPLREDFLQNYNNSAPKPETLYDAELGYQINKGKLTLGVNAYYMHYKNQLVLTGELNDVGGNIRTNVDQSYRLGLETNWSYALSSKIIWAANIALSDNRIQEFVEVLYDYTNGYNAISNVYNNSHIAFSPAVVAASNITLKPMLRTEISLLSKYVGKQYLDNTSNEDRAITPYVTNDLRLSYTVFGNNNRKTAFTLLVNNVLSTLYASNGYTFSYIYGDLITENFYYPQAKANFLAGVNFSF